MIGKEAVRRPYEDYDEDGAFCWLDHMWQPWIQSEVEDGEAWSRRKRKELYRSCYRCPKFQTKEVT